MIISETEKELWDFDNTACSEAGSAFSSSQEENEHYIFKEPFWITSFLYTLSF